MYHINNSSNSRLTSLEYFYKINNAESPRLTNETRTAGVSCSLQRWASTLIWSIPQLTLLEYHLMKFVRARSVLFIFSRLRERWIHMYVFSSVQQELVFPLFQLATPSRGLKPTTSRRESLHTSDRSRSTSCTSDRLRSRPSTSVGHTMIYIIYIGQIMI